MTEPFVESSSKEVHRILEIVESESILPCQPKPSNPTSLSSQRVKRWGMRILQHYEGMAVGAVRRLSFPSMVQHSLAVPKNVPTRLLPLAVPIYIGPHRCSSDRRHGHEELNLKVELPLCSACWH